MLSAFIKWSIAQRWLVILAAAIITVWIFRVASQMPVDVFPSFAPPQVEIQTEAPGLAPEEVESLVTLPIESAINGTPGVTTVRSASAVGLSVVKVIFNWGTDIYQARQLVTERLQQAQEKLPEGIDSPQISPISSPIGTVLQYALTSENTSLMEVRRIVDWQVTNRLLAVPGVSQVVAYGGDIRQYQVLVDPAKLKAFDISLKEVSEAATAANVNAPGGFLINPDQELLIRGVGRIESIEDLKQSVITSRNGLLLVDNYNAKFASGMPFQEVLIKGSMERLNVILMTAFTSALGLGPLVVGGGAGKEILQPLAVVVLGGLFTSTALTLLVIPALYAQFGKILMPKQAKYIQETEALLHQDVQLR